MYKRELRGLLIFIALLTVIAVATWCMKQCGKSTPNEICLELKADTTAVNQTKKEPQQTNKKSKATKTKSKKSKQTKQRNLTSPFDDPTPSIQ